MEFWCAGCVRMSVDVVVRLPSGQADDCEVPGIALTATVDDLKRRIAIVHPLKPVSASQKLVFGGKLLQNALKISDIVPEVPASRRVVVHMVLSSDASRSATSSVSDVPASSPQPATQLATAAPASLPSTPAPVTVVNAPRPVPAILQDGLRQRHVASTSSAEPRPQPHIPVLQVPSYSQTPQLPQTPQTPQIPQTPQTPQAPSVFDQQQYFLLQQQQHQQQQQQQLQYLQALQMQQSLNQLYGYGAPDASAFLGADQAAWLMASSLSYPSPFGGLGFPAGGFMGSPLVGAAFLPQDSLTQQQLLLQAQSMGLLQNPLPAPYLQPLLEPGTTHLLAGTDTAEPTAQDAEPAADGGNNDQLDPNHRFAQAGVGAVVVPQEPNPDAPARPRRRLDRILPPSQQIVMICKLIVLVTMFGQGTSETRFNALCAVAAVIYFFQAGFWAFFFGGPVRQPRPRAPVPPAPVANPEDPAGGADAPAEGDADQPAPADVAAPVVPEAEPPRPPPSLLRALFTLVWAFVSSVVPRRPVQQEA
eukprot:m.129732 g.129732  ORF g.129732 m.129732 type:complete len:532 (+) comp52320_c0_seq1:125-1720(+)